MKKYRICLTSQVNQIIELYAESEEQAEEYGERLIGVDLDNIKNDAPDLERLVFYYSSDNANNEWELEYVEEMD
jgi:hypothetical protein